MGKGGGFCAGSFGAGSPQLLGGVFYRLPQAVHHLVAVLIQALDIKKPLKRGLLTFMTMSGCGVDSETHHPGHSAEIRFQIGMEGGVVVVNGAIRVFQSVACENTDHRGSRRHFVFAFEQTRH